MNTTYAFKEFCKRFRFSSAGSMLVGCEREFFLVNEWGQIVPKAHSVIKDLGWDNRFGYELSACQMEAHIGPVSLSEFHHMSICVAGSIIDILARKRLHPLFQTVGPIDMPLDIYPDPTGRYQRITADMPKEILLAACRVTGTHIHIGMPDHHSALRVYNGVVSHLDELCRVADLTNGERHRIYHMMAKDYLPRPYRNWEDLFDFYTNCEYIDDPRKCWHLIRLSVHGTIEFRMFDNTDDLDLIRRWVHRCHEICSLYI